MSYIRAQFIERDESGRITKGSAAICEAVYTRKPGKKSHSVQKQVERLGKVIWLSDDGKSGIFLSKTRGLVEYSSVDNQFQEVAANDPRIAGHGLFPAPSIHTVFGDAYLLLHFMQAIGISGILSDVFPTDSDRRRFLCHSLHSILKEGARITCDLFVGKSVVSHLTGDVPASSLRTDTAFFTMMGDDKVKTRFFQAWIKAVRREHPEFGKGCYVDTTPLPNDAKDNPFNALCSHGVGHVAVQTRLVLVLDEATGLPVWFTLIPGNVLDANTIMQVVDDVKDTLDIEMNSVVLDAGYVTKELVRQYPTGAKRKMIARMPAKKGYPYKALYEEVKDKVGNGKYTFVRNSHMYFGDRKKITLFDTETWAYIYVDRYNALVNSTKWITEHAEEFEKMKMKDKTWTEVSFGYFVLLSNDDKTPAGLLDDYFGRTDIETVIKTGKEYVNLLPLCKWNETTIRGKILLDIIDLNIYLMLRKKVSGAKKAVTEMLGTAQSLMCHCDKNGIIKIETPNKQVKEMAKMMGAKIPAYMKLSDLEKMALGKM